MRVQILYIRKKCQSGRSVWASICSKQAKAPVCQELRTGNKRKQSKKDIFRMSPLYIIHPKAARTCCVLKMGRSLKNSLAIQNGKQ